jgi:predicted metalloprotease with PDZ domain
MIRVRLAVAVAALCVLARLDAAGPIAYRLSFPEPEHHWMQVEATFPNLGAAPLELRMSQSSPGRYSLHEFAKNVYDVQAADADGRPLEVERPDPHGWTIARPGSRVTVRYKVYGDRVDGTYLGIDRSHAHINMPAAIMWARSLDQRPSRLTFVPPRGASWQAVTQLHQGSTPFEFTAPNLQYLMDSPVELGPVVLRQFELGGRTFRFAAHHQGSASEVESFVQDVQKIVKVEGAIFGEYPAYETGAYTFLADYLPYASGDAMEHRNSTVMTSTGSIRSSRLDLLDTVAHEFFHGWNVERIRPRSLEPFDFERANMSGELWLAEGFTQYYAPVALSRAGLTDFDATTTALAGLIQTIVISPGRAVRSAEEMSRMAPFTDGGRTVDRTNWSSTYISYYPHGGAIALGLDLALRIRSNGRVTLDDFMRVMWRVHGRPGSAREGYVDRPYTLADAATRLAEVSDESFAREFFARYVHGREAPDFAALVKAAGLVLRPAHPGRAWWGDVQLDDRGRGVRVTAEPLARTPAYKAGLDRDDEITQLGGLPVTSSDEVAGILRRRRPGDVLGVEFVDRTGTRRRGRVVLADDPRIELVPVEATGGTPSAAERGFREAWLGAGALQGSAVSR